MVTLLRPLHTSRGFLWSCLWSRFARLLLTCCSGLLLLTVNLLHSRLAILQVGLLRPCCASTQAIRLAPARPVCSVNVIAFCVCSLCPRLLLESIPARSRFLVDSLLQLVLAPLHISLLRPQCAVSSPARPALPVRSVQLVAFPICLECPAHLIMGTSEPLELKWAGERCVCGHALLVPVSFCSLRDTNPSKVTPQH